MTAARQPASTAGSSAARCLTAKDQPVISPVENLDRGQLGGAGLIEGGDTLQTRHLKKGGTEPLSQTRRFPHPGPNLGVGACGRGSSGQSRCRRRPGPGGSTRVMLPITGEQRSPRPASVEKTPGDLGGRYALQVGVAPHSNAQKAPQGVRGEMRPVSSAGRCLSLPRGLGGGFSASARSLQTAAPTARFLPEFTIVAGGSRLSHAQPAAPVASEQAKNRQFVPHP